MKKQKLKTRFIVLTGGPGAGKTAVLELARKAFPEEVAVLPEAASIIYGGGFWRKSAPAAKRAAQRAIYSVQREMERMVQDEARAHFVLCDRGTLDGLAYWPGPEAAYFREMGTTRKKELLRYDMIIHLRTPAAELGYNHANPLRIESALEASVLDQKILHAWKGHSNRYIIDGTLEFLEKANRALDYIRSEIEKMKRR